MPITDITPPPGLNKIGSRYTARNQWFNGNLVRFLTEYLKNLEDGQIG